MWLPLYGGTRTQRAPGQRGLHGLIDRSGAWCNAFDHSPSVDAAIEVDYSITSSARRGSAGGMFKPSALAVFMLTTSSYLLGACTGRSLGFSPRKMRSTWPAAPRKCSV